ncbi:MAG: undecaprenyl-diphosphate phosphatase [Gammaproteobacteria bacterium]|nr:undecaprenyl-diphosphate phosphatase [Gammaproteobacteria bacterium]
MDYIQAIWLALLQGLTEFLPISSSAHLILLPELAGWVDQGVAFDVAVHVGTLMAVVLYYRQELSLIIKDWLGSLTGKSATEHSRLAWHVVIGTLPAIGAGLIFVVVDGLSEHVRSALIIAATTIIFGLLLWLAQMLASENRNIRSMNWVDALIIGVFQAIAFIPGTSRSGITITAGLLIGLERKAAARFSFLLSIPLIVLAGLSNTLKLLESSQPVHWDIMALGVFVSALVAYITIGWFLKFLDKVGLVPFVIYRLLLGGFLIYMFL